jgi:hypothetical protein
MARFFLHLHERDTMLEDWEGQECGSLQDAMELATETARDVMTGEVREGRLSLGWYISIVDGSSREVGRVHFRDAVKVTD